ncbi:glycosyl transferase [Bacteroides sp. 519]|uniref:glycosyl transferase n=1 Tax=Bacteroides sp. 519 TaxID=2302937 RepID=UPI0013D5A766|nr:glycosyl transferase [Bacteroides sp. 519]NDV60035.1 glycosyl transferase [Bacteroides sp. 519]
MITFVPVGGLANRMRAVLAAIALAQDTQSRLHIIWYRDWALKCRFDQLFQPLNLPGVTLKEATIVDLILRDRPRRRNFHLPKIFQTLKYDARIYEKDSTRLKREGFDFKQWTVGKKNCYIASWVHFHSTPNTESYKLFVPQPELLLQIEEIAEKFTPATIGIHIRRTDNAISIDQSPTEQFIQRMNEEIEKNPETTFYLATDSQEDKSLLQQIFGERVITSTKKVERNNPLGIQHAVVELYLLSRTSHILGSFQSSYSEAAAYIGNIKCEMIQKQQR